MKPEIVLQDIVDRRQCVAGNRCDFEFAAAGPAEPSDGRVAQVLVDAMPSSYPAVVIPVIR